MLPCRSFASFSTRWRTSILRCNAKARATRKANDVTAVSGPRSIFHSRRRCGSASSTCWRRSAATMRKPLLQSCSPPPVGGSRSPTPRRPSRAGSARTPTAPRRLLPRTSCCSTRSRPLEETSSIAYPGTTSSWCWTCTTTKHSSSPPRACSSTKMGGSIAPFWIILRMSAKCARWTPWCRLSAAARFTRMTWTTLPRPPRDTPASTRRPTSCSATS